MSDAVSMARSAREQLAQALAALQAPGVPPHLLGVAEPVARAMTGLHQAEATAGASLINDGAAILDSVRRALSMLQAQVGVHPAVDQAVQAIAGSLNQVHLLTQPAAPQPAGVAPAQPPAAGVYAGGAAAPARQPAAQQPQYAQPQPAAPPQQYAQPRPAAPQPQYAQPQPAAPQQQYAQPRPAAPQQYAQPQHPAPQGVPPTQQQYAPPAPQAQPAQPQPQYAPPHAPAPTAAPNPDRLARTQQSALEPTASPAAAATAPGELQRVDAELGAHSPSNFYKGLSGNDVVDAGGIFVATYQCPPVGAPLLMRVALPGGYEFEAKAVVRWNRERPRSSMGDTHSPPGFGARFTEISSEARQLVYRYVRNREPLFHDDS